jgi:hypothetical protein
MTAIERWRKGIFGAICAILVFVILEYLLGPSPLNQYVKYFLFGSAFFGGWLAGSEAERKSNRIRLTS